MYTCGIVYKCGIVNQCGIIYQCVVKIQLKQSKVPFGGKHGRTLFRSKVAYIEREKV